MGPGTGQTVDIDMVLMALGRYDNDEGLPYKWAYEKDVNTFHISDFFCSLYH